MITNRARGNPPSVEGQGGNLADAGSIARLWEGAARLSTILRLRNGVATKPICGGWQPFSPSGHHPNRDSPKVVAGPSVAFGCGRVPSSGWFERRVGIVGELSERASSPRRRAAKRGLLDSKQ